MLIKSKFSRKTRLFKRNSLIHLISFIVLFNVSAFRTAAPHNLSPSQQSINMVKIGLTDIPEKGNFGLEYFIKERAYLKLLQENILPYLKRRDSKTPTCFISYAWGDPYHEYWVKRFCEMLNKAGIKVLLDGWIVKKGTLLNEFIKEIEAADWVIVVGTKLYMEKYNKRAAIYKDTGHVARLERQLIEYLVRYSTGRGNRVVPILLEGTAEESLPFMLSHKISVEFTKNDYFEELLKLIHDLYNIDNKDKHFEGFIERFRKYAIATAANITDEERKAYEKKLMKEILELDRQIAEDIVLYKQEAFKLSEELEENNYSKSNLILSMETILPKLPSYIPYPRLKEYIPRRKIQDELSIKLYKQSVCVVCGHGGIGKSTLATQYGYEQEGKQAVRWITAETQDKLITSYESMAKELGISDEQLAQLKRKPTMYLARLTEKVYNAIEDRKQPTLLILDNAIEQSLVAECLSHRPFLVQVIITTRNRKNFENYSQVELSPFTPEEGKIYIQQRLQNLKPNEQDIEALIKEVGLIPQKLVLATGYISVVRLMNVESYLNKLRALKEQGKKSRGKLMLPEVSLGLETLDSLSQLMMRYGAYLDPDFIPLPLVSGLLRIDNEKKLNTILVRLEKLSLITIINGPNKWGVQINREVQAVCKEYQGWRRRVAKISKQDLVKVLVQVMKQHMPEVTRMPDSSWEQARLYASNVSYVLAAAIEEEITQPLLAILMGRMGSYSKKVACNYEKALSYHQEALAMRQALYSDNHPDIASSLNDLGSVCSALGKYEESLKYYQQAFAMQRVFYPDNHPNIASSLNDIGIVYSSLGQPQEALKYLSQAFEMRQALYKGNHIDIASSLNNLGIVYEALGKYEESLKYHQQAFEMRQTLYTGNHPDIAMSLNHLGKVYKHLRKYEEALKYCKQALYMRQALYKDNHIDIADSLNNLGIVCGALGKYEESLKYYQQAFAMQRIFYPDNDPAIAGSLSNLGDVCRDLGKYEEALEYYRQALYTRQALYKGNHPYIANTLNSIGTVYRDLGKSQEAMKYYQDALKMFWTLYPNKTDHPDIQKVRRNIEKLKEEQQEAEQNHPRK
ncbi:MAG: hypothetical protein BGO68_03790 [Candidatus Amoebophilus sp. 36-38]|nr:MAG: hypothetical protein BGO68_03790 [Candidatus Amoebophilus sp. 36-38]